jgi:hypothetical protein
MQLSAEAVAAEVVKDVHQRALELARALDARLAKPRSPRIARDVATVVRYAQRGSDLSNERLRSVINTLIDLLSVTCFPPATSAAREIFDRKAGEPQGNIELVLLGARARLRIELGLAVPIRWLAALAGVSVKTARNLASAKQIVTHTTSEGQQVAAEEAARWLGTRGLAVAIGSRQELSLGWMNVSRGMGG